MACVSSGVLPAQILEGGIVPVVDFLRDLIPAKIFTNSSKLSGDCVPMMMLTQVSACSLSSEDRLVDIVGVGAPKNADCTSLSFAL